MLTLKLKRYNLVKKKLNLKRLKQNLLNNFLELLKIKKIYTT